jgi:MSHA pilin protein MshA
MKNQAGFTLIELIAVVVILGILAATAVPKFMNMSGAAQDAAVKGIAGNLGSAMSINYAAAVATSAGITGSPNAPVDDCQDALSLVETNTPLDPIPGYTVASQSLGTTLGVVATCTVTHTASGKTAQFQGIAAP